MSLKIKIKSEIRETLSSSSIHSFPNIIQNKYKTVKFIWAVCFIVSSASCAYFIATSISEYFEYDVVSKSTINYKSKVDFPIISICGTNAFSTDFAFDFMRQNFELNMSDFDFTKSTSEIKYDYLTMKYLTLIKAKSLNESIQRKFGNNLDYILVSCLFNLVVCDLSADFEYYYDVLYGNCFRYNSRNERKQITNNGIMNGLQLELFIGRVDENFTFSIDNGINLFIEDDKVESQTSEGIRISSGTETFISLSKYSLNHLPKPYSDCTAGLDQPESSNNIFYRNLIANNIKYRKSLCRFNCFQKYTGDLCKCQDLFTVPFYKNLPFCYLNKTQSLCSTKAFTNFSNLSLFESCDCPVRCSSSYYTYKLSYSKYPTKFYAQFLFNNKNLIKKYNFSSEFNYEDYRNNLASIYIFFDELKETIVDHRTKITEVELISNIGGTLGKIFDIII
jgi:hypothetical protein